MTTSEGATPRRTLDQTVFRDVIGRFASGVTVITTTVDGKDYGTTASAVSSLSMEPPMLLICLNRTSETREAITRAQRFAVNILSAAQSDIAYSFATKAPDKFAGARIDRGPNGMPLIPGSLAQLESVVTETAVGGTHTVFLGEVLHAHGTDAPPLTYYRGRFGRFTEAIDDLTYQRLRDLVIGRELAHGQVLDVDALAQRLAVEAEPLLLAMSKLAADGLLEETGAGAMRVRALDVGTAHEAIDARCAIEIAAVDRVSGRLSGDQAAHLRRLAIAARDASAASPRDLDEWLRAGQAFHEAFIGQLGNDALAGFFARLDFRAIWSRAIPDQQPGVTTAAYLVDVVDACVAGDADRARAKLYEHAAAVKRVATAAIESGGGEL